MMATKSRLHINIETDLKEEVGTLLDEIGLDYTTAITIYFKQIVNERKIPFELHAKKWYSVEEVAGADWQAGLDEVEDGCE